MTGNKRHMSADLFVSWRRESVDVSFIILIIINIQLPQVSLSSSHKMEKSVIVAVIESSITSQDNLASCIPPRCTAPNSLEEQHAPAH
eukprot:4106501-Amphidinium_carterae.1